MVSVLILAKCETLAEGTCKGFSVNFDGETIEGVLVHKQGTLYAYRNSCPHTGAPLDWMPDQFFDNEGRYIQCSMHGALFEPDTGLCVYGPCISRKLQPLPIEIVNKEVRLVLSQTGIVGC